MMKNTVYHCEVFRKADGTYGYNILKDSVLLIRQENIPAKAGNAGFGDSGSALHVARFVTARIEAGNFPPTVKPYEIDSILTSK